MALTLQIEDGQVVSSTTSTTTTTSTSSTGVDSDTFLQLLVAEMKYQDPLEPTSNTEWVSQYATFTQVEQMTELSESVKQMEASSLVGKTVIMKSTSSSGDTSYYSGVVSYMTVENGEISLCVSGSSGEKIFSIDELDTIVDADYLDAITVADAFEAMVNALPSVDNLTSSSKSAVEAAREAYESMTDYQKQFVDDDVLSTLETLEEYLEKLLSTEESDDTTSSEEDTETDSTTEA